MRQIPKIMKLIKSLLEELSNGLRNYPKQFIVVLVVGLVIRLVLLPFFIDIFNYWGYFFFVNYVYDNMNPYTVIYNDPTLRAINPWRYPPGFALFLLPGWIMYKLLNIKYIAILMLKIFIVLSDIITAAIIYIVSWRLTQSPKIALIALAAFLFNPISIIVSAIHGTNDPIANMFLLSSIYMLLNGLFNRERSNMNLVLSAIFLALSFSVKIFAILFLIPFYLLVNRTLGTREAIIYIITFIVINTLIIIPFLLSDPKSTLGVMITGNLAGKSGVTPANPFLPPSVFRLTIFLILYLLLSVHTTNMFTKMKHNFTYIVLFITSILPITTLSMLYFSLGTISYNYTTWVIPYSSIILAYGLKHKEISKYNFGLIIYVLVCTYISILFINALFWNGFYDLIYGATGFYYWALLWLNKHVKLFVTMPTAAHIVATIAKLSFFFPGVILLVIIMNIHKILIFNMKNMPIYYNYKLKIKSVLAVSLVITIFVIFLLYNIPKVSLLVSKTYDIEFNYPMIYYNKTYKIYDSFNTKSILTPYWQFSTAFGYRDTYYELTGHSVIISCSPEDTSFIYYGRKQIIDNSLPSGKRSEVEIKYRLLDSGPLMIIMRTNGGWFGYSKKCDCFIYFDDIGKKMYKLIRNDKGWHTFRIIYINGKRVIVVDNKEMYILKNSNISLTYIKIGNTDISSKIYGKVEVDYAKITIYYSQISPKRLINFISIICILLLFIVYILVYFELMS